MSVASSVVTLLIRAQSAGAAGLASIRSQLLGLASDTAAANSAWETLRKGLVMGVGANIADFAVNKVQEGISFLQGKFQEATQLQLDNTVAVSTLESLARISFDDATKTIDGMNASLAKAAAALPGSTQDYKNLAIAITGTLIPAFKNLKTGEFRTEDYSKRVGDLSETYGAIAAASGQTAGVKNALNQALNGASSATLLQLSFFEKNRTVIEEIKKKLRAIGRTNLSDVNKEVRSKILLEAGQAVATDSFKKRSAKTVDGLIQSFVSSLFDSDTGIFGIMRNLSPAKAKSESAFSAMNKSLELLVGEDGIFNQIGKVLDAAGVQLADPMKILYSGVQVFNEVLAITILSLESATESFKNGNGVVGAITSFFSTAKSYIVKDFANVDFGFLGGSGVVLGAGGVALSFAILNSGVFKLIGNLSRLAIFAGNEVLAGIETLGMGVLRLSRFLWMSVTAAYASGVAMLQAAPAAASAMFTKATIAVVDLIVAMKGMSVAGIVTGAKTILMAGWTAIPGLLSAAGAAIWGFVTSMATAGIALLANPIVLGIAAIIAVGALIYKYWDPIGAFFQGFTAGLIEGFEPLGPLFSSIGGIFSSIGDLLAPLVGWFKELLTPVKDTDGSARSLGKSLGEGLGGGIKLVIGIFEGFFSILGKIIDKIKDGVNFIGGIPNAVGNSIATLTGQKKEAILPEGNGGTLGAAASAFSGFGAGGAFGTALGLGYSLVTGGARYNGQIPNAAGGLFDAARKEMAEKPSGARLVVANSQEFILQDRGAIAPSPTPAITVPMPVPTMASKSGGNTYIFQIQGGSNSPEAIAQEVMSIIQQQVENELESSLVP